MFFTEYMELNVPCDPLRIVTASRRHSDRGDIIVNVLVFPIRLSNSKKKYYTTYLYSELSMSRTQINGPRGSGGSRGS